MKLDRWIRRVAAGMSGRELRAVMRGDPPTEQPNPRQRAHAYNLLLHFRPRSWPRAAVAFTHTYHLGFFAVFFLLLEVVTGLFLMLYYVPTPEGAYISILRIKAQVPFGDLLRDMHRLGGEVLVVFAALHLLRTYLTASYKDERRLTWITGIGLLTSVLTLAFSGYLLPWDQVAYWAVTIGTSMAEAVPLVGRHLNLLLRGGPDIGADGLLRFYLLHVGLLPVVGLVLLGWHYYRVSRRHGLSLPAGLDVANLPQGKDSPHLKTVPFIPDMATQELLLAGLSLLTIVIVAAFFYDAPLEGHADPGQTPLDIEAPWFFLWIQGLLKLGDKLLMGVIVPCLAFLGLLAVPLVDRSPRRKLRQRPIAVGLAIASVALLLGLGFTGTHHFGIEQPPTIRITQDLTPQEGRGPIHAIPHDQLAVGLYTAESDLNVMPPKLSAFFTSFQACVARAGASGGLPQAEAILIVEAWQADLRRVTLRILWEDAASGQRKTHDRVVHLHRNRNRRSTVPE